ncbi:MAG: hypothetical protein HOI65_03880 [Opitutae bacterium]|nr:hypothetical protein [Opitutae bacterium]
MRIKVDRQRLAKMAARRKNEGLVAKYDNTKATAVQNSHGFLFGLGFAIIVYVALFPLWVIFKDSDNAFLTFLHHFAELFYERGWVPYALIMMMGWGLGILFFKSRKLKYQRQAMHYDLLPSVISDEIRVENIDGFAEHLDSLKIDPHRNFLMNRVLRGLEHFSVRRNHSDTANMLASQSEIDATTVESSYTLLKVFIWAIPILGFIGTVIGISDAVASFSGELDSAGDIDQLRNKLSEVTQGLGVAFDTTLVALVMSLIVMFPTTMTQKAEEDLLNQVDDYSNENFLKRLREDHLAGNGEPTEQMAHLQQQMMELYQGQTETFEHMSQLLAHYNQYMGGTEEEAES